MTDEPNEPPKTDPAPADEELSADSTMRLVPLSDIDAFVTVRASAIMDEAAILCIQFLGGGDRDRSRREFVDLCMERFDETAEKYDMVKMITAVKLRRDIMMRTRARQKREAAEAPANEAAPPEPEEKPE